MRLRDTIFWKNKGERWGNQDGSDRSNSYVCARNEKLSTDNAKLVIIRKYLERRTNLGQYETKKRWNYTNCFSSYDVNFLSM